MMNARTRLLVALPLACAVAAIEFWGAYISHSLALAADAAHVCMDVLAFSLALATAIGAARPANRRKTFGYGRIEVLGALANGALLLGATIIIVYEALQRLRTPVETAGVTMTIIAIIGFTLNVVIGATLGHAGEHQRNLNLRAAVIHAFGDALGALAVAFGGVVIALTGARWIDPLLSLVVSGIIVFGVLAMLRDAVDVLLEGAPRGIDSSSVERCIGAIGGVAAVHDLHVWTIASGASALSAHVLLEDRRISEGANVLRTLRGELREQFGITHVTVQLECDHCDPDRAIICPPLL